MPIDFPNSPTVGQRFEVDGRAWEYDGSVWEFLGPPGPANELIVGTVTTGAAGTSAAVTITGDSPQQTINFTIPRGDVPTITLGTVTTGNAGTSVIITNSGTATNAIFNFTIPRGQDGASSLALLTDTTITGTPSDNSLLAYDTATSKWINQTASQANVAALSGATFTGSISGTSASFSGTVSGGTISGTAATGTTSSAATGVGYMGIPSNGNNSGAYQLVIGDAGEHIYTTTSRTVTIPANSSVAFPIGTAIVFISGAEATTTIAITSDTLLLAGTGATGSRTLAAHGIATAVKVASTTWYISGNGLT